MNIQCRNTNAEQKLLAAEAADLDWEAVYLDQLPRLYNYFRFRTGNNVLAEDLSATTFEKAWRAKEQYNRDLSTFSTWLFTIARNVATDEFRQHRHVKEVPLAHLQAQAEGQSVADAVQRQFDITRLVSLLRRLSARDRELIELKYGAAFTNRAIAQLIGLTESNVGTLLHRAIQRLRGEWEGHDQ